MGNVIVTISDKKLGRVSNLVQTKAEYYEAIVKTASDYYPFGWQMPNRKLNTENYSFGFNGQVTDVEWNGGQSVNYTFRVQETRIGRFLSVDPLASMFPWYTPYQFAGNMPIWAVDLEGAEPQKKASGEGTGTSDEKGASDNSTPSINGTWSTDLNVTVRATPKTAKGKAARDANQAPDNIEVYDQDPDACQCTPEEYNKMNKLPAGTGYEQQMRWYKAELDKYDRNSTSGDMRFLAEKTLEGGVIGLKAGGAFSIIMLTGGFAAYTAPLTMSSGVTIQLVTFSVVPAGIDMTWQLAASGRWNPTQSIAMGIFKNPGAAMAIGQTFPVSIGYVGGGEGPLNFKFDGWNLNRAASLSTGAAIVGPLANKFSSSLSNGFLKSGSTQQQQLHNFFDKTFVPILGNTSADGLGTKFGQVPINFNKNEKYAPVENFKN